MIRAYSTRLGMAALTLCFLLDSPVPAVQKAQPEKQAVSDEARAQSASTADDPSGYRIGVEDELQIAVWREPELSTVVVVRPDGIITLPLLNDVKVTGLKTEELRSLVTERLKSFVNDPQVTVIVRAIRSRKVHLVGNVVRQGSYTLNGQMTVLELLAAGGGIGTFAKSEAIYVLREENGKKTRIPFQYKKALAGKSANVLLRPGDVVVVP